MVATVGWLPSCNHYQSETATLPDDAVYDWRATEPCTVLDPFAGSGTTNLVARRYGRRSIGIELNPDYCQLIADRTMQQTLI
jgi:DNA modification methylase